MTFYRDLLCETAAIGAGNITEGNLLAAARRGFYVQDAGFAVYPCRPHMDGGIDKNPLDGMPEIQAVFGDLSVLDLGDGWGTGAKDGITFGEAFTLFCHSLGQIRPGTIVGYWDWLTGPEGDAESPRFQRLRFNSIDELLRHQGRHNQVVLVRTS